MKQGQLYEGETVWFHVFKAMYDSGDVAKMGSHALNVYLAIKSHVNFESGKSWPSIDTIATKAGISDRQVMRELKTLEEFGYLTLAKEGRKNVYTLREKVALIDETGQPSAVATWDYLPATVKVAQAELKNYMQTGVNDGRIIHIETLTLNIGQLVIGDHNVAGMGDQTIDKLFANASPATVKNMDKVRHIRDRLKPVDN